MGMRIVLLALAAGAGSLAAAEPPARVANPASALCVKNGATMVVESDENGGERGVCVFPDGTRIPEWTYFRNKSRLAK